MELDRKALTLEAGKAGSLVATVKPDNAADRAVTWKSSDEGVATVDQSGNVTGVRAGKATVTATAGGKSCV